MSVKVTWINNATHEVELTESGSGVKQRFTVPCEHRERAAKQNYIKAQMAAFKPATAAIRPTPRILITALVLESVTILALLMRLYV